jgi:dihydropteroate synthase
MGIVNVTPDSFSDGGRYDSTERAVDHALRLLDEGADQIDIGGESTRPGAAPVSVEDEATRVVPVIEGVSRRAPRAVVSVDTSKAEVARRAIDAGARIVNDVTALGDPDMGPLCARTAVTLILMHMRGRPRTMQHDTHYDHLVDDIRRFLAARVHAAVEAGVDPAHIVIDPGVGFGKALADNPRLVAAVPRFAELGFPVLIGASRKAFIGRLTGVERAEDRVFGSVGVALAAAAGGADILRVHDVAATHQALTTFLACTGVS